MVSSPTFDFDELASVTKERSAYLENLTATQARCTELLVENRALHAQAAAFATLRDNIRRAQSKHPWPNSAGHRAAMMLALAEEVGKLAKEMLEGGSDERIKAEAIDVATVAIRIAMEK